MASHSARPHPSFKKRTAAHHQIVICEEFLRDGSCALDSKCGNLHHENLSPKIHKSDKDFDGGFTFSTDKSSEDCQSCAIKGIKCDRAGRGGPNNPCTWCRFFGGPGHVCQPINGHKSPNDVLWDVMLSRKLDHGRSFTIPDAKFNEPMLNVKEGWTSAHTRQQLLANPSLLLPPVHVRMHPRVYLQYYIPARKLDNTSTDQSSGRDTKRQKIEPSFSSINTTSILSGVGHAQLPPRPPPSIVPTAPSSPSLQPATLWVGTIVDTEPIVGQGGRGNFWRITYSCGTVVETPVGHPDPSGRFIPTVL